MLFFRKSAKSSQLVKPGYENVIPLRRSPSFSMEGLEERQFLSASVSHHHTVTASAITASATVKHSSTSSSSSEILFSAAPTEVQTGLQALAPTGTTLSLSQEVNVRTLGDGSIIYSTRISSTGVVESLTVDASGSPVTLPTGGGHFGGGCGGEHGGSSTTLSAVSSTIATALQAQAPTGVTLATTQTVNVHTDRSGNTIYSTTLLSSGTVYVLSVDSTGATVTPPTKTGITTTTYTAAPAAVQTGLTTLAGGTIAGTQVIDVFTRRDGTTIYSTTISSAGVVQHLTVDSTGAAASGGGHEGHRGRGHGF